MATPKKPHLTRNIGIAVFLIMVLIVAVGATIYSMRPMRPTVPEFNLSLSSSNGTVIQGSIMQISVAIFNFSGRPENVSLSGNVNSSGINCNFEPVTGTPNFISTLTIIVQNSTSTNYYSLNVTATNGEKTHTASYSIAVLSTKVLVTGKVYVGQPTTALFSVYPITIQFSDTSTGTLYSSTINDSDSYSVSLDNEHTYNVTYTYQVIPLGWFEPPYTGEARIGSATIFAGVGNATQIQNFAGTYVLS